MAALASLTTDAAPGQVETLAAGTISARHLLVARVEDALEAGYRGLRLAGANQEQLAGMAEGSYTLHEAAMDETSRTQPVSPVCCIDADTVPIALVDRVLHHHRQVAAADFRVELDPSSVKVAGALDLAAEETAWTIFTRAAEDTQGVLNVDLTDVSVLAAAGVRALLEGTRSLRESGGLVAVRTGPAARLVFDILHLGSERGFVVQPGTRETDDADQPDRTRGGTEPGGAWA